MRKRDRDEIFTDKYEDGYKGFNFDMKCFNFKKYEVGKVFKEIKAKLCECGIHYCKKISEVFSYYPPGQTNKYSKIKARILKRKYMEYVSGYNKKVTTSIYIEKELSIYDIVYNIFFKDLNKIEEINYNKKILDTNEKYSGITIGNFGDVKCYKTIVTNNTHSGVYINNGRRNIGICQNENCISALDNATHSTAITNGNNSIAATKDGSSNILICDGDYSRAYIGDNQCNSIAITNGKKSCVDSTSNYKNIILCGFGLKNIAKGKKGTWLILAERSIDNSDIINIRAECIDNKNLKENTYYTLINNNFIEIS